MNTRAQRTSDGGPGWDGKHGVNNLPVTSADAHLGVAVTDAPADGQKLVITDFVASCDVAVTVTFKEETSGTVIAGPFNLPANFPGQILTPRTIAHQLPTAGKKLYAFTSGVNGSTANMMFDPCYFSEK